MNSTTDKATSTGGSKWLWAILALALIARLVLWLMTYSISSDSPFFLFMARDWEAGRWASVFYHEATYHPFYPILIGSTGWLLGGLETAGYLVSIFASTLVCIPIFLITKDIWNERIALLGTMLYAVHPTLVDLGSEVMTEGVFSLLFVTSVALAWAAYRMQKLIPAIGAGLFAGLALLTRAEGIFLPLFFGGLMLPALLTIRKSAASTKPLLFAFLAFSVSFLMIAVPWSANIKQHSGRWHFTTKRAVPGVAWTTEVEDLLGKDTLTPPAIRPDSKLGQLTEKYGRLPARTIVTLRHLLSSGFQYLHLPLILAGLILAWRARKWMKAGQWFLLLIGLGYLAPAILLFFTRRDYISSRYFIITWILLAGFGGATLAFILDRGLKNSRAGIALLVLVCIGVSLGKSLEFRRYKDRSFRHVGEAIRKDAGDEQVQVVGTAEVAWYANAYFDPSHRLIRNVNHDRLIPFMEKKNIRYVAATKNRLQGWDPEWFTKAAVGPLEEIDVIDDSDPDLRNVRVYRLRTSQDD